MQKTIRIVLFFLSVSLFEVYFLTATFLSALLRERAPRIDQMLPRIRREIKKLQLSQVIAGMGLMSNSAENVRTQLWLKARHDQSSRKGHCIAGEVFYQIEDGYEQQVNESLCRFCSDAEPCRKFNDAVPVAFSSVYSSLPQFIPNKNEKWLYDV